jgi:hypothetical protein
LEGLNGKMDAILKYLVAKSKSKKPKIRHYLGVPIWLLMFMLSIILGCIQLNPTVANFTLDFHTFIVLQSTYTTVAVNFLAFATFCYYWSNVFPSCCCTWCNSVEEDLSVDKIEKEFEKLLKEEI